MTYIATLHRSKETRVAPTWAQIREDAAKFEATHALKIQRIRAQILIERAAGNRTAATKLAYWLNSHGVPE